MKDLIAEVYEVCGQEKTTDVADAIKTLGFEYAMRSGTTLAVADISIPPERKEIIEESLKAVELVQRDFRRGLLTEQEKNEREIEIWQGTTDRVVLPSRSTWTRMATFPPWRPRARRKVASRPFPSWQVCAVSWLTRPAASSRCRSARTSAKVSPRRNTSSPRTARKGLADTALRTADAGYLTRRLVDIAQDIIINEHDCGTHDGVLSAARMTLPVNR